MFAAAKNLGQGADGMGDLLTRLRAREKARRGVQVHVAKRSYLVAYVERRRGFDF